MPFAQALIQASQLKMIPVSIDASTVGHACIALVAGLVYKKRSLAFGKIRTFFQL